MYIAVGKVRRISQLTGEWDRAPGRDPIVARNQTLSSFGIAGTDLGSSFFDGDRLWFLFGDTWPDPALGDAVAWTRDTDPEAGLSLTFLTGAPKVWKPPTVERLLVPFSTGVFEVPTGGFAVDGRRYVVYTSDYRREGADNVMGSSSLCRPRGADDDLADLQVVFELSRESNAGRFINVAPVVTVTPPVGLPFAGPAVLMWGSGRYRKSHAYLAVVPANRDAVETPEAWRYYGGLDAAGAPRWITVQSQAAPLFAPPAGKIDGGIGEISAMWVAPLRRWLLTYTTEHVFGAVFRTAVHPWGPWSDAQLLFDPNSETLGFGGLLHRSWDAGGIDGTDLLYDRGRGPEGGAPYGPYLIDRFTRAAGPSAAQIYFAVSTWNPYQAHLMTAVLEQRPGSPTISLDHPPVHLLQHAEHSTISPVDQHPLRLPLPTGGLAMVQSRFGPKANNFELAVPALTGGILFLAAQNDPWPPAWGPSVFAGQGRDQFVSFDAASMLLSNAPDGPDPVNSELYRRHDRLVVAGLTGGRAVYLIRDRQPPWHWSGPYPVIAVEKDDRRHPLVNVRGNPALIAATLGNEHANWELLVADATSGIRHYWFDNDPQFPVDGDWRLAPTFGQALGRVDAVTLIQSVFGDPERGNLEVVARCGTSLHVLWRDGSLTWHGPFPLVVDDVPITTAGGFASLLQSKYGTAERDFQLVTPLAAGGLAPYWRDNSSADPANWRWHASPAIDPGTHYLGAALVAGPFGPAPGNLELVATSTAGEVRHFFRGVGDPVWQDAGTIPLP